MLCLDTNAVIAAINQRTPTVRRKLEAALIAGTDIGIPAITLYEMWYGIRKSARPEANAALLQEFLTLAVTPWAFEGEDAVEAGDIRATLEKRGTTIGSYDILIAAQARRRGATLVTANTGEFTRVPKLKIENWAG